MERTGRIKGSIEQTIKETLPSREQTALLKLVLRRFPARPRALHHRQVVLGKKEVDHVADTKDVNVERPWQLLLHLQTHVVSRVSLTHKLLSLDMHLQVDGSGKVDQPQAEQP